MLNIRDIGGNYKNVRYINIFFLFISISSVFQLPFSFYFSINACMLV